jgi:hypothetical protein
MDAGRRLSLELLQVTSDAPSQSTHFLTCAFHRADAEFSSADCELVPSSAAAFRLSFRFTASYRTREPGDALIVSFSVSNNDDRVPLARLVIPIADLPRDQQVVESFSMEPLFDSGPPPRIFLRLCDSFPGIDPFGADLPLGVLAPREREAAFTDDHRAGELPAAAFGGSGPLSFAPGFAAEEEEDPADAAGPEFPQFPSLDLGRLVALARFSFFPTAAEMRLPYRHPQPLALFVGDD